MRRPRAFALVIVVVCSVAMVAIALALVFTAGANRLVSVKGSSIDQSETIALAGMERAVAYAERVADVERDFDLLLDPNLVVNCPASVGASPQTMTNDVGLPRFSDGTVVEFETRKYLAVPFNKGAYLIRFDDDADDAFVNSNLTPFTSNRVNAGKNCKEGPDFGDNNAFRDRNRTVWVSVIGIYPGVDPARARHRTMLRRLHTSTAALPGPAIHVKGNIDFQGDLRFCSNVGDISAGGNISFSGDQACGRPTAQGNITGTVTSAASSCPANHCTAFAAPVPLSPFSDPPHFAPNQGFWFNARQPTCNFYVVRDPVVSGLFYWDATRAGCAGPASATDTLPSPATVAEILTGVPDARANCWVPVMLGLPGGVALDAMGTGEVNALTGEWKPSPTGINNTTLLNLPPSITASAFSANKPAWANCKAPWKGVGGSAVGCSGPFSGGGPTCNSSSVAADVDGLGQIRLRNTTALPAGVYRFEPGDEKMSTLLSTSGNPSPTNDDAAPDEFGLATFIVDGNFEGDTNATLGYGMEHAPFASLVVKNDVVLRNGTKPTFGGSLVSIDGNITLESGFGDSAFHFLGMIVAARGNLTLQGGGKLDMDYDDDLFGGAQPVPASATTSKTIR